MERKDTGVIAQELREVLPDAVRETGDVHLSSGVIKDVLGVNKVRRSREQLCVSARYSCLRCFQWSFANCMYIYMYMYGTCSCAFIVYLCQT